jgi:Mitochondrial carrier protein
MLAFPRAELMIKQRRHHKRVRHVIAKMESHHADEEVHSKSKVEWIKEEVHKQMETHHLLGQEEANRNNRFYLFVAAFTATYIYGLNQARQSENEIVRMGAAGSLTVLIGESSFYFIDAVNTRSKILHHNTPFYKMLTDIVKTEGIRKGLYKGYSASFYGSMMYGAIYFYLYKGLKVYMKKQMDGPSSAGMKAAIYASASTIAECVALSIYYPFELIKVRLLTKNDHYQYNSVSHAFKKIATTDKAGPLGLYRGLFAFFFTFMGQYTL